MLRWEALATAMTACSAQRSASSLTPSDTRQSQTRLPLSALCPATLPLSPINFSRHLAARTPAPAELRKTRGKCYGDVTARMRPAACEETRR